MDKFGNSGLFKNTTCVKEGEVYRSGQVRSTGYMIVFAKKQAEKTNVLLSANEAKAIEINVQFFKSLYKSSLISIYDYVALVDWLLGFENEHEEV